MARPKRNIEAEWIDIFCDWDIAEQERTLTFLTELHRQAKRQASRKWSEDIKIEEGRAMLEGLAK